MSTTEYTPDINLWSPKLPLPARDTILLQTLGLSYEDLVFADYKLVWDRMDKTQLSAKDVQRMKHIRKREKNKLFARGQFQSLEVDIRQLTEIKQSLLETRENLRLDCEFWKQNCVQATTQFTYPFYALI